MLITCPECGKQVSSMAKACPNCGMPIVGSKPKMPSAPHGDGGQNVSFVRVSELKKSVALAFALFLGMLGSHNRYLGYNHKANVEFGIFVLGLALCIVGIGVFVILGLWIWAIVETLNYKTDADGGLIDW